MAKDQIIEDQVPASASMSLPSQQRREQWGRYLRSAAGFTLMELIVVSAIIGILATFAMPAYRAFVGRAKNARAMSELRLLETEVYDYQVQFGVLPANLADINRATLTDPWGNLYIFNDFRDLGTTQERRYAADPLNDDFDLYSKGEDGVSEESVHLLGVGNLGSDDLVRGSNGAFLGTGAGWVGE